MATSRPDIVITDHENNSIAAIEVKNRQNMSADIAQTLRRNLIMHGFALPTRYYLLLSQDNGYLWKNVRLEDADAQPSYQFPITNVITRYLHSKTLRRLGGAELELVLLQWLIALTLEHPDIGEEPEHTLQMTGFLDDIQGGKVVVEEAA